MKSKYTKREEAAARQTAYDALTVEQKIALCKSSRGQSKRQLARLATKADAQKP